MERAAVRHEAHNRTPDVFLSYRREDTGAFARWLGDRLKHDLRLENVFLDVRDVFGGDDWRAAVADRIAASDVVIALVGPLWAGPRPNGTWRIFDDDDVVRWELARALSLRPSHVVPAMLDGAQLPRELPHELMPLQRAQRVDLTPRNSLVGYSELLGDVFMKAYRRRGGPVIVTDGSDQAEVYLDRLAHQLKSGQLGVDGVVAVNAVTRGFAAVSLRDAAAHWPEVIVLRHPGADDEKLSALVRGVRRNTLKVIEVGAVGGVGGVTFEFGRSLHHQQAAPDAGVGSGPSGPSTPPAGDTARRGAGRGTPDGTSVSSTTTASAKVGAGLAAKLAGAALVTLAVVGGAALLVPTSPSTPAAASATTSPEPPTGPGTGRTGTPPTADPPTAGRPNPILADCPDEPFWGTFKQRFAPRDPSGFFGCWYTTRTRLVEINLDNRVEAPPAGARQVQVEGADEVWVVEPQPGGRGGHLLVIIDGQTFEAMNWDGTGDDALSAAKAALGLA